MNKYLPSKKFTKTILSVVFLAIVILISGNIVSGKETFFNKRETENNNISNSNRDDFFAVDSDGDGLYDWEEALWGTNPRLKDSDNDGVEDKKFVENKRQEVAKNSDYKPDENNQTENFAKQLFTTSAVLNQNGFSQEQADIFSQNIEKSFNSFSIPDKYTLSDLKLSNISPETYHNNFLKASEVLLNFDLDELYVLASVIEKPNDENNLKQLALLIDYYKNFENQMLSITVPYINAGNHLAIVNNLYKLRMIFAEIVNTEIDPMKSISYFSKYNEYSEDLDQSVTYLENFFIQNGIIE